MYKTIDKVMHWVLIGVMGLLFLLLLTGCARKSAVITNTAEAAKETINVAVKQKPECADVGELAKRQITIVEDNCQLVMVKEKKNEWNDGLRVGILGTIFVLLGLGFILQRFDK